MMVTFMLRLAGMFFVISALTIPTRLLSNERVHERRKRIHFFLPDISLVFVRI